jgi:hypothetical protein
MSGGRKMERWQDGLIQVPKSLDNCLSYFPKEAS